MREATLLLIFRTEGGKKQILLAQKKRGFGMDKWNGPGGKVETDKGETPEQGVIREAKEEVGLTIKKVNEVGTFIFDFPHKQENNFHCYLYATDEFEGVAAESEEMAPQWFDIANIPYDHMWDDDKIWLPLILEGKKLTGKFSFDETGKVITYELKESP